MMFLSVFYNWPKTKPKQVEMDGLLALEVGNKVERSPQGWGASVLPVDLKNQAPSLSELPSSLHHPWRWTGTSSAHHTSCFEHLPFCMGRSAPSLTTQTSSR